VVKDKVIVGVAGGDTGMRVHGQREVAMDQVHLAVGDVIVHELPIGGGVQGFASRALKVAEDLQNQRRVLRTGGFMRVDVGDGARGLRRGGHGHEHHADAQGAQNTEDREGSPANRCTLANHCDASVKS